MALGTILGGIFTTIAKDKIKQRVLNKAKEVALEVTGLAPESTEAEIEKALLDNPEALARVKEAASAERQTAMEQETEQFRIAMEDRSSARMMNIQMDDNTQRVLAFIIVGGFFVLLGVMFFVEIPESGKNILNIMVGSLGTLTASIANFYFGSSRGSRDKSSVIETALKKG